MAKLKITQTRSQIRENFAQKRTLKALGLGRVNRSVLQEDTPQIRGMLNQVKHLVTAEEVNQ